MDALDELLALTDPNKTRETAMAVTPPQRDALDDLLEQTDPQRENNQSALKDTGSTLVRGALDQGVGGSLEGAARLGQFVARGGVVDVPGTSAQQLDTRLRELTARRRELAGDPAEYATFASAESMPVPIPDEAKIAEMDREILDLQKRRQAAVRKAEAPLANAADKVAEFRGAVRDVYPVDKDFERSKTGQVIGGVSQMVASIPAYLTGLGLPATVGQMFDQGYQDAKGSGADDQTALTAGVMNLPSAALEYGADKLALGGVLEAYKAGKVAKKVLAAEIVKKAAESFASEGATEGAQQMLTNVVAKSLYDPKRKLSEGVGDSMLVGGITGGLVAAGTHLAGEGMRRISEDTGRNVPESAETLRAQQAALLEGRQRAQMFPEGTKELPLPKGMERVETPRGVFHFDPWRITGEQVVRASAAGRENEILGLGPASKADVETRAAAGEPMGSVVEQTPDGREVKAAMVTPSTAPAAAAEMTARKAAENTVSLKNPAEVVQARTGGGLVAEMLAKDKAAAAEREQAQVREVLEREARLKEAAAKRARFDETMRVAVETFKNPDATFAQVDGALKAAKYYAEDNSLGLPQEQKARAVQAAAALEKRLEPLRAAEETRAGQEARANEQARAQAEADQKAKLAAEKAAFRQAEAAGIGADGAVDYSRLTDDQLGQRAQTGDAKAAKEMDRRVMMGDQPQRENLRDVLAELKLPATDAALGRELQLLKQEVKGVDVARYFSTKKDSLDRMAEALRERGFSYIRTPDDVIKYAGIALRGKPVWASEPGRAEVDFARLDPKKPAPQGTEMASGDGAAQQSSGSPQSGPDSAEDAYHLAHRPNPDGPRIFDLLENDLAPRDIYEHPDYYSGQPGDIVYKESLAALRKIRNKPDAEITVYRASPRSQLNHGDWVSLSKTYAQRHGMADNPSEDMPVHEFKVRARDIRWPGDSLEEYGFFPDSPRPNPSRGGGAARDFARGAEPKSRPVMDPAARERTLAGLRRSSPSLMEQYDVEAGLVDELLKKYAADNGRRMGPVPENVRAAVTRIEGKKGLIALAAEAFESRDKVAALTTHEVAHAYWDSLTDETKRLLRELRQRELLGKSGPLYDDAGNLRSDLEGIEDKSEWGVKEWFAERVARLNEAWAAGRIAEGERAEHSLIRRLAYELRELVRKVWESIARSQGFDADSELFENAFRRFWLGGADAKVGVEASTAFARAEFARRDDGRQERLAKNDAAMRDRVLKERGDETLNVVPAPDRVPSLAQKDAEAWAKANLVNKPLVNDDTKGVFQVTGQGISKMIGQGGAKTFLRERIAAIYQLPALVKEAKGVTAADVDADPNIDRVHHLYVPWRWQGKTYRVRLLAREFTLPQKPDVHSYRIEDVVLEKQKPASTSSATAANAAILQTPMAGSTMTLRDLFADGNLQVEFARKAKAKPENDGGSLPLRDIDAEIKAAERELQGLREGNSQEDAGEIEARGKALTEKIAALKKEPRAPAPMNDEEMAAKLKPASALEEKAKAAPSTEKADWLPTSEELDAAEVIAQASKVEALPPVDRKAALMELLAHATDQAKKMRAKDSLQGDIDAQWQEKRAAQTRATLDKEFPGWEANKQTSDVVEDDSRPGKPPEPPERPPETAETAQPDDGEESPFLPKDEPLPVRPGKAAEVYGHSGATPSAVLNSWEKVRNVLSGIRGAVPELPTFAGAKWNAADQFIREKGAAFYNRVREGYRQLKNINDYVQKRAEEDVAAITKPLIRAGDFDAAAYKRLVNLQEQRRRARADGRDLSKSQLATIDSLNAQVESSPYVIFQKLVLMLDLNWRQQNLKDSAGNPIRLPFDINQAEVAAELERLAAAMETSTHRDLIAAALEKHMALVKRVSEDLKKRDLLAADHLENPYYFPHITLETTRGGKTEQRELAPERVRPGTEADFRGYLIDPVGSAKAIETDYVRAMYYHLVQVGAHNEKADIVQDYFRHYDVKDEVEARARKLTRERGVPISWEQAFHEEYAPKGYVLYGTDSLDAFPTISVDRDKLAKRLGVALTSTDLQSQFEQLGLKGVRLLPEDLKESMEMGARETWVVPARVAEALRGIATRETHTDKAWDAAMKFMIGAWKRWKLFMPHNHIRYEFGNISADLEKIFSADPEVFKYLAPAAKELRDFWRGGNASEDLRAALKEGVLNAVTAQEMHGLAHLPNFKEFHTKAESAWAQVRRRGSSVLLQPILQPLGLGNLSSVEASALREAITRYSKFKADIARLRNGSRPVYAGAYWKDVDAMTDSRPGAGDADARKAGAISKATFGDYSDTSVTGQTLREKFIPFYSWLEVNFKYHANLFRNLRDMVRQGEMTKGQAIGSGAKAATTFTTRAAMGFALRLALPYVAVALWNNSGDREKLEDELSEEDKRRFHVILGRDDDGKVLVSYAPLAFMDVMKWFSGPEAMRGAIAWMRGQTDFPTAFDSWRKQLVPDLVNNAVGQAGPLAQIPAALATKKRMFPDVTDPRTIPEYDMRRSILSMVTDDFTADMIERAVNKDYYAPKDFGDWSQQLILQVRQRDPEAWAYFEIRDKAADFMEKRTGSKRDTSYDAPDQQVLRNFRKAIYRGDLPAAMRFYQRALDYGYTAERFAASVRAQDPLATLAKKDGLRRDFVEELSPFDREQLKRAFIYYDRMNSVRGKERQIFPSERGGERAARDFQQKPRFQYVQGLMDAFERRNEEELRRRAEAAEKKSLAPARR